jgi:hypothetical protein
MLAKCSATNVFFENRKTMMNHLEQEHELNAVNGDDTCPICFKDITGSSDALSLHLTRHMEKEALAFISQDLNVKDEWREDATQAINDRDRHEPGDNTSSASKTLIPRKLLQEPTSFVRRSASLRLLFERLERLNIKAQYSSDRETRKIIMAMPLMETAAIEEEAQIALQSTTAYEEILKQHLDAYDKMTLGEWAKRRKDLAKGGGDLQVEVPTAFTELLAGSSILEPPHNASSMNHDSQNKEKRFSDELANNEDQVYSNDSNDRYENFSSNLMTTRSKPKPSDKHNSSQENEKQHSRRCKWICMVQGPRFSPTDAKESTSCAFCMLLDPTEDHFQNHHRIQECIQRDIPDRTFFRSDHLRQHAKNFHGVDISNAVMRRWRTAEGAEPLPN